MPQQILVVDDDPNALRLISYALHREGFDVTAAQSGQEALALIAERKIDLVVLDVMMPQMDGYEVCERLRANPDTARLPIIMLTAKSQVEDKVRGFKAGADDYVTKPVLPAELVARVRALLVRSSYVSAPAPRSEGKLISFVGAKGGVGTTTIAINVAVSLADKGKSVILADFSLSAGMVALQLGLPPAGRASVELLSETEKSPSARAVQSCLVAHNTGIKIFPAPARGDAVNVNPSPTRVRAILESLRSLSQYVIVDAGAFLNPGTLAALRESDRVVVVTESDHLALELTQQTLDTLSQSEMSGAAVEIVMVNRARSATVISKGEAETRLKAQLTSFIIPAPEMCFQANRNHVPIMVSQPGNLTVEQIRELADHLML